MIVVEQHPFTFSAVVATTLDVLLPSAWEGACEVREAASTSALSHGQAIAIQIGGCGQSGRAKHKRIHGHVSVHGTAHTAQHTILPRTDWATATGSCSWTWSGCAT